MVFRAGWGFVCSVNIVVHEGAYRLGWIGKRANKANKDCIRLFTHDKRLISCEGIANEPRHVKREMANEGVM